jgi:hypothetical protein
MFSQLCVAGKEYQKPIHCLICVKLSHLCGEQHGELLAVSMTRIVAMPLPVLGDQRQVAQSWPLSNVGLKAGSVPTLFWKWLNTAPAHSCLKAPVLPLPSGVSSPRHVTTATTNKPMTIIGSLWPRQVSFVQNSRFFLYVLFKCHKSGYPFLSI